VYEEKVQLRVMWLLSTLYVLLIVYIVQCCCDVTRLCDHVVVRLTLTIHSKCAIMDLSNSLPCIQSTPATGLCWTSGHKTC